VGEGDLRGPLSGQYKGWPKKKTKGGHMPLKGDRWPQGGKPETIGIKILRLRGGKGKRGEAKRKLGGGMELIGR